MCRCYDAAIADGRAEQADHEVLSELYEGRGEFRPHPEWTLDRQIGFLLALARGEDSAVPETWLDWMEELAAQQTRKLPATLAYEAAAAMFNATLAEAHRHGERLKESPTNAPALGRAIRRQVGEKRHKRLNKNR